MRVVTKRFISFRLWHQLSAFICKKILSQFRNMEPILVITTLNDEGTGFTV